MAGREFSCLSVTNVPKAFCGTAIRFPASRASAVSKASGRCDTLLSLVRTPFSKDCPRLFQSSISKPTSAGARRGRALQEVQTVREEENSAPDVTKLVWDSPLTIDSIVKYPDPRLRAPNGRIATFDEDLKKLASEMFDVMYEDDGVGLAAPQVGVNAQLMVFNPTGEKGKGEEFILCNPRVISSGKKTESEEEGCLSFPGINGDVEVWPCSLPGGSCRNHRFA